MFRRPSANTRRITRKPSPAIAYLTPWVSIVLASAACGWPMIAVGPLVPPLGFLALLGWRQLHPGLLPAWAGLPLGFADDLLSGQPMGSGILTWSLAMLALDVIEFRWPWRNFVVEWAVAAAMIVAYILITALLANAAGGATSLLLLAPQLVLSVLVYPVVGRVVARLDMARLTRFRVLG
jgi:rod shape-determining protein MreD